MTKLRTLNLPKGFKKHDGGVCPIDPESYVEVLIRTSEGIGNGGVQKARMHEWRAAQHEGGLGAIVAYRSAQRGETRRHDRYDRFNLKGVK